MQVWEWDPVSNQNVLMIDADPMLLSNDPRLAEMMATFHDEGAEEGTGKKAAKDVLEFLGFILIKFFEILIEILV